MVKPKIEFDRYELTLTDLDTGKSVKVTLVQDIEKWKVMADGYHGYFKDLEMAYKEACRHLKYKQKEMI